MLTPLDIQSKSFASAPMGYKKNEVDAFKEEILAEYETLYKSYNEANAKIKELKKTAPESEEYRILCEYAELCSKVKEYTTLVKDLNIALDESCRAKYAELTIDEIKELLVNRKWYYTIFEGIKALYVTTSHEIAGRVAELAERYEDTLQSLESKVNSYEAKVKSHLERMGFVW